MSGRLQIAMSWVITHCLCMHVALLHAAAVALTIPLWPVSKLLLPYQGIVWGSCAKLCSLFSAVSVVGLFNAVPHALAEFCHDHVMKLLVLLAQCSVRVCAIVCISFSIPYGGGHSRPAA
jgi:hypothetical protein